MKKLKDKLDLFKLSKIQLISRINSLELINEELQETIKSELYSIFMEKIKEPQESQRLKRENKNLRSKVKTLKQLLKGDKR